MQKMEKGQLLASGVCEGRTRLRECGACGEHVGGGGKQRAELPPAAGAEGKVHLA